MSRRNMRVWLGFLWCGLGAAALARAQAVQYGVAFKGESLATQTVAITQSGEATSIAAAFEIEMPVFIARHRYAESLSATHRPDGTVERFESMLDDNSVRTEVRGELSDSGRLRIVRTGPDGVTTNFIEREDYDFHSLILYGTAPEDFLPTNRPARVLSVAEGRVIPMDIQVIKESDTFERQYLSTTHLVWKEGPNTSHSWHPERFSHLPRRYIRQTRNGEFTFTLMR